jgi:hypothetical protein
MKDQVVLIHVVDHYDVLLLNEVSMDQHHFDKQLPDDDLLLSLFFEHSNEFFVVD